MTSDDWARSVAVARWFAFAFTGRRAFALDDAFADAGVDGWLKAARTWDPARGSFQARLVSCIRGRVIDALRRMATRRRLERPVGLDAAATVRARDARPVDFDSLAPIVGRVERAIARDVLLEGRTVDEAAARAGVSPRTAAARLASARQRLAVRHG